MMETVSDAKQWAEFTYGSGELGDVRRTRRLVQVAADLAQGFGASLSAVTGDDTAALVGAYRFVRSGHVSTSEIAEACFRATRMRASDVPTLLAIEDTTTLSFMHATRHELGDLGGPSSSPARGFFVHSVLLLDADRGSTLGLIEQSFWRRDSTMRGQRHARKQRHSEDKESFKWRSASEVMRARLGDKRMKHVVSVCDREADFYEYLATKLLRAERFVVRACRDRCVANHEELGHLWPLMRKARLIGRIRVHVAQRTDRPARTAVVTVRARRLQLRRPASLRTPWPERLGVGVVWAYEENPPPDVEPLEWMLLTSESVGTRPGALRVLGYYSKRWRIEDFHRLWKSGAGVERCRMQSAHNIERFATILAGVAVRAMQLRDLFESSPEAPCDAVLTETEWKVLWATVEKKRPPKRPPSAQWAYRAIGRLAGWADTKRTGRVGAKTLMTGWLHLEAHVAGYEAFKLLDAASKK